MARGPHGCGGLRAGHGVGDVGPGPDRLGDRAP